MQATFARTVLFTMALMLGSAWATPARAQEYMPADDYLNLSEALFKVGILRPNDPAAVDEYLRLRHCGLFEQYGGNDIAWSRIRESQARDLILQLPAMNERIEVVGNLLLGPYDAVNGGFRLDAKTTLENLTFVNITEIYAGSLDYCKGAQYRSFVPRVHPLRLRARLMDPFSLKVIPITPERADILLQEMAKRPIMRTLDERRQVMMVLRLALGGADPLSSSSSPSNVTVTADLDEILIYEGPARKNLLYRRQIKKQPE